MEPDKNNEPKEEETAKTDGQEAPADALSKTPDELDDEQAEQKATDGTTSTEPAAKKLSPIKRLFKVVNVYFLVFILIVIIAAAITVVNYLNSQKAPSAPDIASQQLSQEALKTLTNTDVSVGNTSQTLTIQGNAIIAGQTLMRGNLNVAGNIQTGGNLNAPNLTVSGTANLGTTQINSLQVATNTAIQGSTTLRDLNVSGTSSFSGAMTASQITVTKLILSGNAVLQVPNHISFPGTAPSRSANGTVLGGGGTASVNGSDTTGSVTINTGNNPTAGCMVTLTFNQAFTTQPRVIVSPIGAGAGQTQFYVTRNTTSFSICSVNAPPANQSFGYDYWATY